MAWTCADTEERLSDVLDRTLLAREQAAFSAHSARCVRCTELAALVAGMAARMHALPFVAEPAGLPQGILTSTLGSKRRRAAAESWLDWASAIWQPRFAMGLATVAATCLILLHMAAPGLRHLRPNDVNPARLFRAANRQVHLSCARGVKFVNDLRVVYEIHSMFASQPAPSAMPAAEPPSAPERQPLEPGSHEKSQSTPLPGSRKQTSTEFALLLSSDLADRNPNDASRRPR